MKSCSSVVLVLLVMEVARGRRRCSSATVLMVTTSWWSADEDDGQLIVTVFWWQLLVSWWSADNTGHRHRFLGSSRLCAAGLGEHWLLLTTENQALYWPHWPHTMRLGTGALSCLCMGNCIIHKIQSRYWIGKKGIPRQKPHWTCWWERSAAFISCVCLKLFKLFCMKIRKYPCRFIIYILSKK